MSLKDTTRTVNEEKYSRGTAKAIGKKGKALAFASQREAKGIEEEEEEDVAKEEDNLVNHSNDKVTTQGGSEPPMGEMHLTSHDAFMEILLLRRNVMILWSLFLEDPIIEDVKLVPFGSIVETQHVKKVKKSRVGSTTRASSLFSVDDSTLEKLQSLEDRLERMNESTCTMQASLQQSLANHARKNNKMMMQHQKEMNVLMAKSRGTFSRRLKNPSST